MKEIEDEEEKEAKKGEKKDDLFYFKIWKRGKKTRRGAKKTLT